MSDVTFEAQGEREILITRSFAAPRERVFAAFTTPGLIRQWMIGPPGWTMPVCISEARPGGLLRFEWADGAGNGFHLTGEYLELEASGRILHVERMHLPDPTPDNRVETRFSPDGTGTLLRMVMTLPDAETRAAMLATGMAEGMEASYARLDPLMGFA